MLSDVISLKTRMKGAIGRALLHVVLVVAFLTLLLLLLQWSSPSTTEDKQRIFRAVRLSSSMAKPDIAVFSSLHQETADDAMPPSPTMGMNGEMWCVLDENTVQFKHFPHASQALLPCWSWFERVRESTGGGSNMSCGFYIKPDLKVSRWPAQLIELMGCAVSYDQPQFTTSNQTNTTMILHYDELAGRMLNWFEKPKDAAALRSRLLDRMVNSSKWSRSLSSTDAQQQQQTITIVNRKRTRRLVNSDNIAAALQNAYPSALIQTVYMEGMEPIEQFAVFSQSSILIAPHGAALMNGMFLPPGNASAVIEIFPHHYYPTPFFGNLLRSCGIRRYGYYNNETDPDADWEEYGSTKEQRVFYRSVDLEPPVEDIVGLVRHALMEGEHNLYTSF